MRDAKLIYEPSSVHDASFHISLDLPEVPVRRHEPVGYLKLRGEGRSRRDLPPIEPVHSSGGKKEHRRSGKLGRIVFDRRPVDTAGVFLHLREDLARMKRERLDLGIFYLPIQIQPTWCRIRD